MSGRPKLLLTLALIASVMLGVVAPASADLPPGGTFIDDDGNTHEPSIEAIYAEGLTVGCDTRGIRFCPGSVITRGQMAAFLRRALGLPVAAVDHFSDDNSSTFERDIDAIAEAGITSGCNPPANTKFCPERGMTRSEMATLLVHGFPALFPADAPDAFGDDNGNTHEENINRLAASKITLGCNPPSNTSFCPNREVTRGEMATFLARALGLTPITPPAQKPIERVSRFTTYFDCCLPRVTNIRTMARAVDGYVVMPGETFSIDSVVGPTTSSKGYVPAPYLVDGEGECCAVGGGVSQFGTTMYNAVFWGGYEIVQHKPHSGWISRYPLGIEATLVYSSIDLKFTNDTTTPVYIHTSTTSTSLTVELWGNQGGWRISGYHPKGNRSSVVSVLDAGGPEAKRVSAKVTGSAPGTVKIVRTLTQNGVPTSQTWWWTYVS